MPSPSTQTPEFCDGKSDLQAKCRMQTRQRVEERSLSRREELGVTTGGIRRGLRPRAWSKAGQEKEVGTQNEVAVVGNVTPTTVRTLIERRLLR